MLRLYHDARLAQCLLQILQVRLLPVPRELLKAHIGQRMMKRHLENLEWHRSNMGTASTTCMGCLSEAANTCVLKP